MNGWPFLTCVVEIGVLVPIASAVTDNGRIFPVVDVPVPVPAATFTCPVIVPVALVGSGAIVRVTVYAPPGADGFALIVIDTCMINEVSVLVFVGMMTVPFEKVTPLGLFNWMG